MFKNVLIISDGSSKASKAEDIGIDIAKKYQGKVSALYIMDQRSPLSFDEEDDFGGEVLDNITSKAKDEGVVVVEHIITAHPIDDIKTMISKINPDLVLLGSNGLAFDEGKHQNEFGSLSKQVLKVSNIPVLLVK